MQLQIPHENLPAKNSRVAVAVSGGVDSMVLLHWLIQRGCEIVVLHVNYRLRNTDSDLDEKLVRDFCVNHSLKAHFYLLTDPELLELKKGNLQEKARDIRYRFFYQKMEEEQIDRLYLAHHLDDQLENFFIRIFRKSGLKGMQSMHFQKGPIFRPFLPIRKQEIMNYANFHHVPFREDISNKSNIYLRNFLRNEALPLIESKVPRFADSAQILIQHFQNSHQSIQKQHEKLVRRIQENQFWEFESFDHLEDEVRVHIADVLGWSPRDVMELMSRRQSINSASYQTVNNQVVFKDRLGWVWESIARREPRLKIDVVQQLPDQWSLNEIYLDGEKVEGNIYLRKPEKGERFPALRLKGNPLISKILKDAKRNAIQKKNLRILVDQKGALWIPGIKIGQRALADESSKVILRISLE